MAKVAVIGSGIAGLVAARTAQKQGHGVKVFEAADRSGGRICSVDLQGEPVETGPQTLMRSHPYFDRLAELAGLSDSLRRGEAKARNRYVWNGRELCAVPMSPVAMALSPLVGPLAMIRILLEPFRTGPGPAASVRDFFSHRVGRKITDNLIDPIVSGIWAGDPDRLNAAAAFPKPVSWVSGHGSLLKGALASRRGSTRGPGGVVSFKGGMSAVVDGLVNELVHGVELGRELVSFDVPEREGGRFRLEFSSGPGEEVDRLILAVPAPVLSRLVRPLDVSLSCALAAQPHPPVAVVNLYLESGDASPVGRAEGFGALVPSTCPVGPVLGVLTVSDVFPRSDGGEIFTVYLGGRRNPGIATLTEKELVTEAIKGVRTLFRFTPHVAASTCTLHRAAIPQYEGGQVLLDRARDRIEKSNPGLNLLGNWSGGVSVLDTAQRAAEIVSSWEASTA